MSTAVKMFVRSDSPWYKIILYSIAFLKASLSLWFPGQTRYCSADANRRYCRRRVPAKEHAKNNNHNNHVCRHTRHVQFNRLRAAQKRRGRIFRNPVYL